MRIRGRIKIITLLILMTILVLSFFAVAETLYLNNQRETLKDTAATITRSGIDQLYAEINQMWYEINLISGTIARSEEVQRFSNADSALRNADPSIRLAVNLTRIGVEKVDSVIITDFESAPLFAYGRRDMAVLEDARRILFEENLRVVSPVHFQLDMASGPVQYCVNFTDTPPEYPQVYVIIIYNVGAISRVMQSIDAQFGTKLALFDGQEKLLLSNADLAAQEIPEYIRRYGSFDIRTEGLEIRRLAMMGWHLAAFLDYDILMSHMENLFSLTWLMNITLVATLVIFILIIQQQINNPIRRIIAFMQNRSRDPQAQLTLRTSNEINAVAEGLNHMLAEIQAVTQENLKNQDMIYRIEIEQKRAENAALMMQINPHFLYNTLDGMRGIALAHGEKDLAVMVSAMAYIMRYSVKGGGSATVREELSCIERYMEIIFIRHGGRIRVRQEIDPAIEGMRMPKMILQPLVENAVFHGLEPVSRAGELIIRGGLKGDYLLFTVRDNGKGMQPEETESLRAALRDPGPPEEDGRGHIGLRNIHRRLRLIFGQSCGVEISSEAGRGTTVVLRLYPDMPGLPARGQ